MNIYLVNKDNYECHIIAKSFADAERIYRERKSERRIYNITLIDHNTFIQNDEPEKVEEKEEENEDKKDNTYIIDKY